MPRELKPLKYCPRAKKGELKKATRVCKYRGNHVPCWTVKDECRAWTPNLLLKYCKDNNIPIGISLKFKCVLVD